jgi:hypothetical protein
MVSIWFVRRGDGALTERRWRRDLRIFGKQPTESESLETSSTELRRAFRRDPTPSLCINLIAKAVGEGFRWFGEVIARRTGFVRPAVDKRTSICSITELLGVAALLTKRDSVNGTIRLCEYHSERKGRWRAFSNFSSSSCL